MALTRITDKLLAGKPPRKATYYWDTMTTGLGVRITPKGQVSFLHQRWRDGKSKRTVLGRWPSMTLAEARAQVEGPAVDHTTLGGAFGQYVAQRSTHSRFWRNLENRFHRHVIPALGGPGRGLSTVSKRDLRALVEAKEQEGYPIAARTLVEDLRPFFKWCLERDYLSRMPTEGLGMPKAPKSRERVLAEAEIAAFWAGTQGDTLFGPFYRLLLITGQRRNEVAGMAWAEIDLGACLWTIPGERTKNGKVHLVPLAALAIAELQLRPRFIGRGISGFSKAKVALDARINLPLPWRVHDLRRTVATGMQGLGIPPYVIDKVLNHSQGSLRGVYQRFEYLDERKVALETWASHLKSIVGA